MNALTDLDEGAPLHLLLAVGGHSQPHVLAVPGQRPPSDLERGQEERGPPLGRRRGGLVRVPTPVVVVRRPRAHFNKKILA